MILDQDSVFLDSDPLKAGYKPISITKVTHRDEFIVDYTNGLRETMIGKVPSNILIYGKTGTGKTMVTDLLLQHIVNKAHDRGIDIFPVFIKCENTYTDTAVMKHLIHEFERKLKIPHKKIPNAFTEYFNRVCELIAAKEGVIILVFDEIDKLKNPDVINNLTRLVENRQADKNVCIIGISNSLYFTDSLDPRTKARLTQSEIVVEPYNAEQLLDILTERAEIAFKEDVLDEMVIPLCAALAVQEKGDARRAIDLLRVAGDLADKNCKDMVAEQHVREADVVIDAEKTSKIVNSLPTQSKVVLISFLKILQSNKFADITSTEIYDLYKVLCTEVDMDILTHRRVTDLLSELDMLGVVSTTVQSRGRSKGIAKYVSQNKSIDSNSLCELLYSDSSMNLLEEFEMKSYHIGSQMRF